WTVVHGPPQSDRCISTATPPTNVAGPPPAGPVQHTSATGWPGVAVTVTLDGGLGTVAATENATDAMSDGNSRSKLGVIVDATCQYAVYVVALVRAPTPLDEGGVPAPDADHCAGVVNGAKPGAPPSAAV